MKNPSRLILLLFFTVTTLLLPGLSVAEELTPREIMQRVQDRDTGDRSVMDMEMVLIDKNKKERRREIRTFGMDVGEDDYSLLFFLSPPDTKDSAFLTYDYDDPSKDDDQWMYLPALGKTKRIASKNKSNSFMGSDLSYADFTKRDLDKYEYTLLEETEVNGHPTWKIQSVTNDEEEIDETGVTKSIAFVRKDNFVVVRSAQWLKKGNNRMKLMEIKELKQIDGIWVATEMYVQTKKGKTTDHATILKYNNIQFNQEEVTEELFTTRRLTQGL